MINYKLISKFRNKLKNGKASIGAWMQIPSTDIAEILSNNNFDWIAIDMEHGNFNRESLTEIIRVISKSNTIPLVRLANSSSKEIKKALDSGAYGLILPMIKNSSELKSIVLKCKWPPEGNRGVAFFRGNLWGRDFNKYMRFAKDPIIIPMIETKELIDDLENIPKSILDALFIGPYDLSASLGEFGNFKSSKYKKNIKKISDICKNKSIPCGIHVVDSNKKDLQKAIDDQFQFIAYSIDSVFLIKHYKPDL